MEPVTAQGSRDMRVVIGYYDDADPANASVGPGPPPVLPAPEKILDSEVFLLPKDYTQAQLVAAVRGEGAASRDAATRATTMNSQFPVGSTLSIP